MMNTTQKILLAGIAGLTAGATAGVLMAPDKGKKTRKKLKRSAEDLKQSAEDLIDETKESLKDLAEKGMESVKS
jgi:gas vesicle protein